LKIQAQGRDKAKPLGLIINGDRQESSLVHGTQNQSICWCVMMQIIY